MKNNSPKGSDEKYKTIKNVKITPNDGAVSYNDINPTDTDKNKMQFVGYANRKTYTTDDPRIVRSFLYGICGLFLGIGFLTLIIGLVFPFTKLYILGILVMIVDVFSFIKHKKVIDKNSVELEAKGYDVTIDSLDEKKRLKQGFFGKFKDTFKELATNTFTKDSFKWFIKSTIPIYSVIVVIISILSAIINIFLGLLVFIISVVLGVIYYFILFKVCNKK